MLIIFSGRINTYVHAVGKVRTCITQMRLLPKANTFVARNKRSCCQRLPKTDAFVTTGKHVCHQRWTHSSLETYALIAGDKCIHNQKQMCLLPDKCIHDKKQMHAFFSRSKHIYPFTWVLAIGVNDVTWAYLCLLLSLQGKALPGYFHGNKITHMSPDKQFKSPYFYSLKLLGRFMAPIYVTGSAKTDHLVKNVHYRYG